MRFHSLEFNVDYSVFGGETLALEREHIFPSRTSEAVPHVVTMYADFSSSVSFSELHELLAGYAERGEIEYTLRYDPLGRAASEASGQETNTPYRPLPLQGYGVQLDIKNMEYKAMDDALARRGMCRRKGRKEEGARTT